MSPDVRLVELGIELPAPPFTPRLRRARGFGEQSAAARGFTNALAG